MSSPVVIATATDAHYLPWASTALLSAVEATAGEIPNLEVCLLYRDVPTDDLERLEAALSAAGATLRAVTIEPGSLGRLPSGASAHGGDIGCARFLLPRLLPDVGRALYIDGDTLVRASLAPLLATDLSGHPVAAVKNIVLAHHAPRIRALGLDPDAYFNSGVLLMDLDRWRQTGAADKLLEVLATYGERLQWVDQDALNLVFQGDWRPVGPRWNCQNSLHNWRDAAVEQLGEAEVTDSLEHPAIVHFEGPSWAKPWHFLSTHPMTQTYRNAVAAGPFGPPRLVDATVMNRALARAGGVRWARRVHDRLTSRGLHRCSR